MFEIYHNRYYSPRMKGLEIQVFTITLSLTSTFTVLFYKRKKMPFKFKVIIRICSFHDKFNL